MNEQRTQYRLRIAPSPTGFPHIGTIYQALFNYAYVKRHQGVFLVRIEDTDRNRFVEGAEEVIFSSLDWFGLVEDESPRREGSVGPYRQSERLSIYHTYVQKLLDSGHAYFSYMQKEGAGQKRDYTKSENVSLLPIEEHKDAPKNITDMLERTEKNWVVRMKVPKDRVITFRDEIRGDISFENKQVTEQILLKSDGYPTYHLAVVVDDHLMGITHVVRAEEWISSTPKHVLLYEYFGWSKPKFFHTPDLRNPDKSKLSKRHGHTNVLWYREEGYLPEALLNFLALQGWSHPEEKELFSLAEFIAVFDLKDVRAVGPIFDLTKLNWMNQQYIQTQSVTDLKQKLISFHPFLQNVSSVLLDQLMPLVKTRMQTLKEFNALTDHFFTEPDVLLDAFQMQIVKMLQEQLQTITDWNNEAILSVFKQVMGEKRIRMPVLYHILTGKERGLPLPESLVILGKEKTLKRLQSYDE